MNKLKDIFKEELMNILARKLSKSLEMSINSGIDSNLLLRPLEQNSLIQLNCTLTESPILTKDYMALAFNGNFLLRGKLVQQNSKDSQNLASLPVYNKTGKQIQIYFSENIIKSAIAAFHSENLLEM